MVKKIKGMRWWIVGLLFTAAVLNYIDRQTLSALAPTIQKDLGMTDSDYANIVNIFLIAYTIAYIISGRIVDRLGTRTGTFIFVVWWSVSNMLTAAARGMTSLGTYRFMLGLGEAGIWPAASKAVSEWFPAKQRAFAIGLYTMGATIGATIASQFKSIQSTISRFASHPPILTDKLIPTIAVKFLIVIISLYKAPSSSNEIFIPQQPIPFNLYRMCFKLSIIKIYKLIIFF